MSGVAKILRAWTEPNGQYQNWRIAVPRKDGGGEYVHKIVDDKAGENAQALVGQPAFIQEMEQIAKSGKPYKRVVAVHPAQNAQDPGQSQNAGGAPPAASQPPAAQPNPSPAPAAAGGSPNDKDESMFLMGICGRAMGSGSFQPKELPALIGTALFAWRHREHLYKAYKDQMAGKPSQAQQEPPNYGDYSDQSQPLNDDIPF